jgi:excinuclease UvrABC ATPase subunit
MNATKNIKPKQQKKPLLVKPVVRHSYNDNLDKCHCCDGEGVRLNWWSQKYNTCDKCNGTGKFDYGS